MKTGLRPYPQGLNQDLIEVKDKSLRNSVSSSHTMHGFSISYTKIFMLGGLILTIWKPVKKTVANYKMVWYNETTFIEI